MNDYRKLYRHARRMGYCAEQAVDLADFFTCACGLSYDRAAEELKQYCEDNLRSRQHICRCGQPATHNVEDDFWLCWDCLHRDHLQYM